MEQNQKLLVIHFRIYTPHIEGEYEDEDEDEPKRDGTAAHW